MKKKKIIEKLKSFTLYKVLKALKIVDLILFILNICNDIIRFVCRTVDTRIKYFFLTLHILIFALFRLYPRTHLTRSTPLIVSLTSYPARFKVLHLSLFSLITQKLIPDEIVLWLVRYECANHPVPFLVKILTRCGITIKWVGVSYKPYNKLLYSLKEYPNASIVICDDDIIYPRNWLSSLYEEHLKTPDMIIGHRGYILKKINKRKLESHETMLEKYNHILYHHNVKEKASLMPPYLTPGHNIFLEGVGGILFPPLSLPQEVFNTEVFLKLTPMNDDIWFKVMAIYGNTLCKTTKYGFNFKPKFIHASQDVGLYIENIHGKKNDTQFKQSFDFYNLYKYII